jgi:hypothetical protein
MLRGVQTTTSPRSLQWPPRRARRSLAGLALLGGVGMGLATPLVSAGAAQAAIWRHLIGAAATGGHSSRRRDAGAGATITAPASAPGAAFDRATIGQPSRPARVLLYGDSLASQAHYAFALLLGIDHVTVQTRTFPGTALCDWLPQMAATVQTFKPDVVVVEFSGNNLTACITSRVAPGSSRAAVATAYRADAIQAAAILSSRGARVIFTGAPVTVASQDRTMQDMYAALAASLPHTSFVDTGLAVAPDGHFTWTLPCLAHEPGCSNGVVVVRAPDGVHFCPAGPPSVTGSCPVWSGGAFRFGAAMAAAAIAA